MEIKTCEQCGVYPGTSFSTDASHPLYLCPRCAREEIKKNKKIQKEITLPKLKNMISSLPTQERENEKNEEIKKIDIKEMEKLEILQYGRSLVYEAYNQEIDPVVGREQEIDHVIRIVGRKTKKNAILIGEPGVGKTAIIEGLAQRIVEGNVPEQLMDVHIISLDLSRVVSGTKYRGEFEKRIKNIIDEVKNKQNIILFIDEVHQLIGAGKSEGAIDAADVLKPALSRGEIQLIGATTLDEYQKYIESDRALMRRFQTVLVEEPGEEETKEIIQKIKDYYGKYHRVEILNEAVDAAIRLSVKYLPQRHLPDKAIDLIDEAASFKKLQMTRKPNEIAQLEEQLKNIRAEMEKSYAQVTFEQAKKIERKERRIATMLERQKELYRKNIKENSKIGAEDIAQILEDWTGIPAKKLGEKELNKIKNLESELTKKIKGQSEAIRAVAKALKRHAVGLKEENRPIGSFMFLGPTGVGKTALAKIMAKEIYGKESDLTRIDMSEYMEKHSVSKLIGASPGYVGYEDEGQLIRTLKIKPYSLVLFDEIEKAHPDVLDILLQVLEDGRITSGKGKVVSAKNAIFVLTSNLGSKEIAKTKNKIGWGENEVEEKKNAVTGELKRRMKPELLNRLDEIVVFNTLTEKEIYDIAETQMKELANKLITEMGVFLKYNEEILNSIIKNEYKKEYGARSIKRAILKLQDLIADRLIEGDIKEKELTLKLENDKVKIY